MPDIKLDNLGQAGVNFDLNEISIPPRAFGGSQNVRFDRNRVRTFDGNRIVTAATGTFHYLLPIQGTTKYYWYFADNTKIVEWDGTTEVDRTRTSGAYTGGSRDRWNGTPFHGIPVLNNGEDAPQYLAVPGAGNFADIPWDDSSTWTDKLLTAKILRTYKNFLIALDITENGSRNPHLFMWSSAAGAGEIPSSWDASDATTLAGSQPLTETNGRLVDAVQLGSDLIVYKEDGIFRVSYVGAPNIFRFDLISEEHGLRAQSCVVDIGGAHVFLSHNGVMMHDGNNVTPLAYGRVADSIFGEISGLEYEQSFLASNPLQHEVWICYPDANATTFPNKCMVLNHKDNTWYPRELPDETAFITPGVDLESTGAEAIEDITGAIQDIRWAFNDRTYNPTIQKLHGVAEAKFHKFDTDTQFGGVDPTCYVERRELNLNETSRSCEITEIWPEMSGPSAVDFYVGSQESVNASVNWEGPFSFNPSSDSNIAPMVNGPLHAVKVQGLNWELNALTFVFEDTGE
jgi:hypothetical protein